jgi:acetylornithine deacetylase/succinyl-diaminopimelate desuccinylase-like protein
LPSILKLRNKIRTTALAVLMVGATAAYSQVDVQSNEWSRLARQIFGELIALDTTHESGDTTPAAEFLAHRLREAGFNSEDVEVIGPGRRNKNLVARLRGSGKGRPILFFAHLDVVAAPRDQWNTDPFTLTERDGNFYGRGAFDVKNEDADMVVNLIRLKTRGLPSGQRYHRRAHGWRRVRRRLQRDHVAVAKP